MSRIPYIAKVEACQLSSFTISGLVFCEGKSTKMNVGKSEFSIDLC